MRRAILVAAALIVCAGPVQAGTRADLSGDAVVDFQTTMDMPFMDVGNPGNAGELSYRIGHDRVCGAVAYTYNIGKFEVTAGQYTEFLNAVASTDTYALYSTTMWSSSYGCKIERSGSSGSYTYAVAADWADRPVNYVDWGDAARFANWLTNGMPSGAQDLTTTEDGSYFLNGATSDAALMAVQIPDAAQREVWSQGTRSYYLIPSEDEWYKAAYHKNDGVTGNYFNYAIGSDSDPGFIDYGQAVTDPDPGNIATYKGSDGIGSPYYRTEVGEHENSESPYGTFDQSGNVSEWTETTTLGDDRGLRGGAFNDFASAYFCLHAEIRYGEPPTFAAPQTGFRIAEVPEPASSAAMLAVGGLLIRRKRRRVA